jgi:1-acyl-sn-glycerol-3-phosphate acyltransferase
MDERRGSVVKGVLTLLAMGLNLMFWVSLLFTVALLKFLVPIPAWRRLSSRWMVVLAENWISGNTAIFDLSGAMPRELHGVDGLRREQWYLVVSNHRSWVDILVLQASFNRRIPFLPSWAPVDLGRRLHRSRLTSCSCTAHRRVPC